MEKTAMPRAPKGTVRADTSPFSRRSQPIEPTPMPIEKTVRNSVTNVSWPPSTSLAYGAKSRTKVAPTSQNQDEQRTGRNRSPLAARRARQRDQEEMSGEVGVERLG